MGSTARKVVKQTARQTNDVKVVKIVNAEFTPIEDVYAILA